MSNFFIRDFYFDFDNKQKYFSEEFFEKYCKNIVAKEISPKQKISEKTENFVIKHFGYSKCLKKFKFSEHFIRKDIECIKKEHWYIFSRYQKLSENFIREFSEKVNWEYISQFQILSEDFIREFSEKVNWYNISYFQKLSEEFIREFQDKVNWFNISRNQKLSEDFIREFKNKVSCNCISEYQTLSKEFIWENRDIIYPCNNIIFNMPETFVDIFKKKLGAKYKILKKSQKFIKQYTEKKFVNPSERISENNVDWEYISAYPSLSEEFIREYKDYFDWNLIVKYQILSRSFIDEMKYI